jgi:3-phenylpropionate/cinnamic acid dioxygenase small subunit
VAAVVAPTSLSDNTRPTTLVPIEVEREIQQFLYEEADLLDTFRFREWLELFTEDARYWAPVRENRLYRERKEEISAPGSSAYFDDDFIGLKQRVERLYTRMAWAEDPPSRTRHLVTNIRVRPTDDPDEYDVESSFYMHRTRTERDHDWIVGKRYDRLRRSELPHGFSIANRTVLFDMGILLIKNLSNFY